MPPRPYRQQDVQERGELSAHMYSKGPQQVMTRLEMRRPGNLPVVRIVTGSRHIHDGVPLYGQADPQQDSPRGPIRPAPRQLDRSLGSGHSDRSLGFTPYGWQNDSLSDIGGGVGGANSGRYPLTDEHIVNQVLARRFKVNSPPSIVPSAYDPSYNLEHSNNNFYGRERLSPNHPLARSAAALLEGLHARHGANDDLFSDDQPFGVSGHGGLRGMSAYGQPPLMTDISPRYSQGHQGRLMVTSSRVAGGSRPSSAGFVGLRGELPGGSTFMPTPGIGTRYYNPLDAGSSFQPTAELGAAPSLQSHAQLNGMPLRRLGSEPVHFASDAQPTSHGFTNRSVSPV
jgi:hypothetical protein